MDIFFFWQFRQRIPGRSSSKTDRSRVLLVNNLSFSTLRKRYLNRNTALHDISEGYFCVCSDFASDFCFVLISAYYFREQAKYPFRWHGIVRRVIAFKFSLVAICRIEKLMLPYVKIWFVLDGLIWRLFPRVQQMSAKWLTCFHTDCLAPGFRWSKIQHFHVKQWN